jgi:dephospho-CoA kinase
MTYLDSPMSFRTLIVATACMATLLSGCGKKTEAELAEEERVKLRADKRVEAGKVYQELAEKFPDHPKAKDADTKAKAIAAPAPKK